MASTTKIVHRNSGTGRFTTERYTQNHQKTTETQQVKVPPTFTQQKEASRGTGRFGAPFSHIT